MRLIFLWSWLCAPTMLSSFLSSTLAATLSKSRPCSKQALQLGSLLKHACASAWREAEIWRNQVVMACPPNKPMDFAQPRKTDMQVGILSEDFSRMKLSSEFTSASKCEIAVLKSFKWCAMPPHKSSFAMGASAQEALIKPLCM